MNERRRQKRRQIIYYLPVHDAATLQMVGHLADISPTGFKLDSPRPLPVGRDYVFRVDLQDPSAHKPYLAFRARSRWYRQDPLAPNVYNVGFEIVALPPGDEQLIQHVMEKYAAREEYSYPWK